MKKKLPKFILWEYPRLASTNSDRDWNRIFGVSVDDVGTCVSQTNDDVYIITGYNRTSSCLDKNQSWLSNLAGLGQVYLIKKWEETSGGSRDDWKNSVPETPDGGYIIAGVTESYGAGKQDGQLIKNKIIYRSL
jgi:hypothetical protein